MRYWQIRVTDPKTNQVMVPVAVNGRNSFVRMPNDGQTWTYSSLNAGATPYTFGGSNPAALLCELDVPIVAQHVPGANATITIHGVSLGEVSSASNLYGFNCAIYGGMARGLPLANPAQAGLLASGTVLQSIGSRTGTDQWLRMYVAAGGSSSSSAQTTATPSSNSTPPAASSNQQPANIIWQWLPGQSLLTSVANTLSKAFPQYSISGAVSPSLVLSGAPVTGFYASLPQFAQDVYQKSLNLISGYAPPVPATYQGVQIVLWNNQFTIFDGTTQRTPKALQIEDFIGQVSWSGIASCQAILVMRGDIQVGDVVTMPPQLSTTEALFAAPTDSQNNSLSFTGNFQVLGVRHVGNSRQASAESWVTTLDLVVNQSAGSSTSSASATNTSAQSVSQTAWPSLYRPASNAYQFFLPG